MKKITFLGPVGATFSHDAYTKLIALFGAPEEAGNTIIPASRNREILPLIRDHGGYGAMAMETRAEGRVGEPVESFIDLLKVYDDSHSCPFHVIGGIRMKIHFFLMAREGVSRAMIEKVISHEKSLGACKNRLIELGKPTLDCASNGRAAQEVAENPTCAKYAALGPASAAKKYGLTILNDEAFEDEEAVTTFFLIGPKRHVRKFGRENRALITYEVPHEPGALVDSLLPFKEEGLNLIHVHSIHAGRGAYHFGIELECSDAQIENWHRAMEKFTRVVKKHLTFGPFQMLSV
jgi:prephenate dehydratase